MLGIKSYPNPANASALHSFQEAQDRLEFYCSSPWNALSLGTSSPWPPLGCSFGEIIPLCRIPGSMAGSSVLLSAAASTDSSLFLNMQTVSKAFSVTSRLLL